MKRQSPRMQGSTVRWWEWQREDTLLKKWVRVVMGSRPCAISYRVGQGSYMCFDPAEVVVDPTFADRIGGRRLLPFRWRGIQVTRLEQLQKLISRMHARHEGGHWEVTTPYIVLGETHEWLANALEDERMERLIAKRFRGARADFHTYARLFAQHVLPERSTTRPLPSRVDALLNACLCWRWCAKFPGSFTRFAFPCEDDRQFWEEQIRPLVERAWQAATSQEASDIAAEILLRIGLSSNELLAGHVLFPLGGVKNPAARAPADLPLPAYAGRGGAEDDASPDENPLSEAPEGDEEPTSMDADPSEGKLWARPYQPLAWQVQPVALRLQQRLKLPSPDADARRVPSGGRYSVRAAIRTQGRLPHVRKREERDAPQGMHVILLIDHTASMGGSPGRIHPATFEPEASFFAEGHRMTHARRVAMTLERACTAIGIPLCIGVAGGTYEAVHLPEALNQEITIQPQGPIIWLRDWSTPPFAEGPKALIAGLYGAGADELVSEALVEACARFRELPADSAADLLLYLNDWEVDEPPERIQRTLKALRAGGTLIFSIYTGSQYRLEEVERMFGKQWTIAAPDLGRLPEQVSVILTRVRQGRWRPARRR